MNVLGALDRMVCCVVVNVVFHAERDARGRMSTTDTVP